MDIRPIKSEGDYDWALAEVAAYFENEPEPGSPEGDRFDVLAGLIEGYESRNWPIEAPDPVTAITVYMGLRDKKRSDLAALLGSKSRASEILARRRGLSLDMIYKLSREWHIPADILVAPYHVGPSTKKARPTKGAD